MQQVPPALMETMMPSLAHAPINKVSGTATARISDTASVIEAAKAEGYKWTPSEEPSMALPVHATTQSADVQHSRAVQPMSSSSDNDHHEIETMPAIMEHGMSMTDATISQQSDMNEQMLYYERKEGEGEEKGKEEEMTVSPVEREIATGGGTRRVVEVTENELMEESGEEQEESGVDEHHHHHYHHNRQPNIGYVPRDRVNNRD